jgi:GAF domain-containing protein
MGEASNERRLESTDPTTAFSELSRIMLADQPLSATLQRIAELARQAVPGVSEASVTLMEGDRARTVVFTGERAAELDERQYEAGYGPCMDAAVAATTIIVDTAHRDASYPDFAAAAIRSGIQRTISVGLPVQEHVIGALNMYADSGEAWDTDTIELAETFASYAAVAIANAAVHASTADLARQLQAAMQSRAVIEQAKGIIMAQRRISSEEAFDHLVRLSQHMNRKLRDVAAALVDEMRRP